MNPNLERGILLYRQSRHEMAEAQLRQSLTDQPDDAYAHALLALCLAHLEKFQDATVEAKEAIHLQPDSSFAHFAHARVLFDRNHLPEARAAIEEAIRLDAAEADYFSLLAAIHSQESRWREALQAAEQGLQIDPEHVGCMNLRAMSMVKLGRKVEAGASIEAALAKHPESALTHANQGWTLLEKGEPAKALEHFREALRLEPENEWARRGIVEALKARNIVYAVMLKYFLWMSRFSRRGQWGIILAGYFGNNILAAVAASNHELAPWLLPLRILYFCFVLMTWMAYPFFNLLLRLNRFGRLALSREQTVASNWFGLCLLCALLGLASCFWQGFRLPWLMAALVFGVLLVPVSAVFRCPAGWRRRTMAGLAIGLALSGTGAVIFTAPAVQRAMPSAKNSGDLGWGLFAICLIGAMASTWVTNVFRSQRLRR
jgi:tetratricopeptide (TPR) repeat protein